MTSTNRRRWPIRSWSRYIDSRIRTIFNEILSGAWLFLRLLIIPRTSEPEHKLYLYLREVARHGSSDKQPPVYLYNLLHRRSPAGRKYGNDRTRELMERLRQIGPINAKSLSRAIQESNRARLAFRRLQNLRRGNAPRISGSQAHAIAGALYFMDRIEYAKLVNDVCCQYAVSETASRAAIVHQGVPCTMRGSTKRWKLMMLSSLRKTIGGVSRAAEAAIAPRGSDSLVKAVFERNDLHCTEPASLAGR